MKKFLLKNKFLILAIVLNLFAILFCPRVGKSSLLFTSNNFIDFLFMLTPIFICIGLLDEWISKDTMIKIIGEKSGLMGILISFLLGVITAVPLYALLPVAGVLLKKNSKISNVLIFICSSASIRIPLLLFEALSMGWKFTLTMFVTNIFIVIIIAFLIEKTLTYSDKEKLYANSQLL